MKKTIYIISQTESELTQRGKRHPDLATLLSKKGYEVNYISSNFYHADKVFFSKNQLNKAQSYLPYKLTLIETKAYYSNFSIKRVWSNMIFSVKACKILKREINEDSIVIIPSRPIEILYGISKLKKKIGFDVIVDIRDVWPDAFDIKNKLIKKAFNVYCNFFLRPSVPSFNKFQHVSPSFLNWLNRYSPSAESEFIPLGYDPRRFDCEDLRTEKVQPPIKIVYIGLLQYQIDIMPFIKAIEKDNRFQLYLYGDNGQGQRYKSVSTYIEKNKINNVFLKGELIQSEVCQHLKHYDIGIIPMITSSMPNKIFDYLASDLPILALGENDCSDFVEDNKVGWTTSFLVDDIKTTNNIIFDQKDEEYLIKKRNVIYIKNEYSRDVLFEKIINVIER